MNLSRTLQNTTLSLVLTLTVLRVPDVTLTFLDHTVSTGSGFESGRHALRRNNMARTWVSFAGWQREVNPANPRPAGTEDLVNPRRPPTNQVPPFVEKITRDDDLLYGIVVLVF
jgi:hypothetical protein